MAMAVSSQLVSMAKIVFELFLIMASGILE
jgi:hypothetical protein